MSAKKAPAKKAAPPRLTSDQLDKIKQADVSNLIRKVKSGKTLTAAERKTLEQAAGSEDALPPELVTTTRLAELFQVNRKSIAQWRLEKRPGIPAKVGNKEPLAEWRAYFAANPSAGHYDGKPRKDRESLLASKVEVEIELLEIKRDRERGKLIARDEVDERDVRIAMALRGMLMRYEREIPALCLGLSLTQSMPLVKAKTRELQTILADLTSEFWQNHPKVNE